MAESGSIYSSDNEVFKSFAFYSAILAFKMFAVVFTTAHFRFKHKVFANQEDAKSRGAKVGTDPDVERVRRAHLNDLENIVPFWILGFLFVATNPSAFVATLLYRVFAISRIIHSVVYILAVPQPARAGSFTVGMFINMYMAFKITTHFL